MFGYCILVNEFENILGKGSLGVKTKLGLTDLFLKIYMEGVPWGFQLIVEVPFPYPKNFFLGLLFVFMQGIPK